MNSSLHAGPVSEALQPQQAAESRAAAAVPEGKNAAVECTGGTVFSDGAQPRVWDTHLEREVAPWIFKQPEVAGSMPLAQDVFQGIPFLDERSSAFLALVEVCSSAEVISVG
jgi:hypothetical protein